MSDPAQGGVIREPYQFAEISAGCEFIPLPKDRAYSRAILETAQAWYDGKHLVRDADMTVELDGVDITRFLAPCCRSRTPDATMTTD